MPKYRILLLLLLPLTTFSQNQHGFLWYEAPQKAKQASQIDTPGTAFSSLSYSEKDKVLKYYTLEALHKVRFTHKVADELRFLKLQDFWLNEASMHAKINQQALILHPELDFTVTHPTSSLGSQIYDKETTERHNRVIKALSKEFGLVFFYDDSAYSKASIPVISDFANKNGFAVVFIAKDNPLATLPVSRMDNGEIKALGIKYFPALFMINPRSQKIIPLSAGFVTQDVLKDKIIRMGEAYV
jgi:conjugal transfer pilus assembly protein TraF